MRFARRPLFFLALALVGLWVYVIAGSGATLLTLFDGLDGATAVVRPDIPKVPVEPDGVADVAAQGASAAPQPLSAAVTPSAGAPLPQQMSTDDLSGREIMRLLEDEIASDTDPTAADEFLRAFDESLGAHE